VRQFDIAPALAVAGDTGGGTRSMGPHGATRGSALA
jgi:hypothetical protein